MTDYLPEKTSRKIKKKQTLDRLITEKVANLDDLADRTGFSKQSLIRILRDGQVPKRFHKIKQIEAQLQYDQKAMERLLQIVDEGTDKDAIAAIRELRTTLYPETHERNSGQQTNNYYQTLIQQVAERKPGLKLAFPGYDKEND